MEKAKVLREATLGVQVGIKNPKIGIDDVQDRGIVNEEEAEVVVVIEEDLDHDRVIVEDRDLEIEDEDPDPGIEEDIRLKDVTPHLVSAEEDDSEEEDLRLLEIEVRNPP